MEKSEKAKQLRALRKYGKKVGRKTGTDGMGPRVFVSQIAEHVSVACLLPHSGVCAGVHEPGPSWTPACPQRKGGHSG